MYDSIYDYEYKNNTGQTVKIGDYKNKNILIVNTASQCGYTPQYADLQKLYEEYQEDLEIIAFPCNQFGFQEPGSDSDIKQFCSKMDISFPISSKIEVNGENAHPIYKYLKNRAKNDTDIKWNFEKFLIDKSENITHYESSFLPTAFADMVKNLD